jgi:flagellar assembly protein FliH
MQAREIKPFLFETAFDDDAAEPEQEQPIALLPSALAAIKQASFDDGYAQGLQAAKDSLEQKLDDRIAGLGVQVDALSDALENRLDALRLDALRLALLVNRKLFPATEKRHGGEEVTAVVEAHLRQCLDAPKVTLRAHPDVLPHVQTRIEPELVRRGHEGMWVFMPDEALSVGDCRLEWDGGGAERSSERIWDEITALAGTMLPADDFCLDGDALAAEDAAAEPPEGEGEDGDTTTPDDGAQQLDMLDALLAPDAAAPTTETAAPENDVETAAASQS